MSANKQHISLRGAQRILQTTHLPDIIEKLFGGNGKDQKTAVRYDATRNSTPGGSRVGLAPEAPVLSASALQMQQIAYISESRKRALIRQWIRIKAPTVRNSPVQFTLLPKLASIRSRESGLHLPIQLVGPAVLCIPAKRAGESAHTISQSASEDK